MFSEACAILFTIGPIATRSLLILVMARSVRIHWNGFLFMKTVKGLFILVESGSGVISRYVHKESNVHIEERQRSKT